MGWDSTVAGIGAADKAATVGRCTFSRRGLLAPAAEQAGAARRGSCAAAGQREVVAAEGWYSVNVAVGVISL